MMNVPIIDINTDVAIIKNRFDVNEICIPSSINHDAVLV